MNQPLTIFIDGRSAPSGMLGLQTTTLAYGYTCTDGHSAVQQGFHFAVPVTTRAYGQTVQQSLEWDYNLPHLCGAKFYIRPQSWGLSLEAKALSKNRLSSQAQLNLSSR